MILEFMYIVCGIFLIITGIYILFDKDNKKRFTSSLFWIIFGVIFIFGSYLDYAFVGALLFLMGILTMSKSVIASKMEDSTLEYKIQKSKTIGNKIFIPAISLGMIAFLVAQFTNLGALIALGISSLVSLALCLYYTKEDPRYISYDSARILQQMGAVVILPQLLGALGSLFTKAGVGTLISSSISTIVPDNAPLIGVIIYCISMALFTIIMGNAFAAFSIITIGIGIPFVINLGGDPVIVGALGLTAGYCGTLMTPMAANFNIVPAMILEMKNKNGVILAQLPLAIALLITHIILMYILAF